MTCLARGDGLESQRVTSTVSCTRLGLNFIVVTTAAALVRPPLRHWFNPGRPDTLAALTPVLQWPPAERLADRSVRCVASGRSPRGLEAVTATGKTTVGIIAAAYAVARGLWVLIIVPGRDLLDQWWYEKLNRELPALLTAGLGTLGKRRSTITISLSQPYSRPIDGAFFLLVDLDYSLQTRSTTMVHRDSHTLCSRVMTSVFLASRRPMSA